MNNKITNLILILLLLSLPFERLVTLEALGFTVKLPYLFGILFIILAMKNVLKNKLRTKFVFDKIDLASFAFAFWSILSVIWSIGKEKTIIISGMIFFMVILLFFIRRIVNLPKQERYLKFFVYLGTLTAVFSFWQFYGDLSGFSQGYTFLSDRYIKGVFPFPRVQSTFFEPGFYAHFLQIPLFLAIYFSLNNKKYLWHLLIISLAFVLTLSRGGLIAFSITTIALLFLLFLKKFSLRTLLPPLYTGITSFILGMLVIFSFTGTNGITSYFRQSQNTSDFVEYTGESSKNEVTRSYTIKVALENWKKHPIFGIGAGAFGSLPEFKDLVARGNSRQTVNSIYFEIMVEEGLVGLVLFVFFLGLVSISLLKNTSGKNHKKIFLFSAILAMFIQYASLTTLYLVYVWVFLGVAALKSRVKGGGDERLRDS